MSESTLQQSPSYKLYYFDARGLAETTRMLFMLADYPFEDIRYNVNHWPQHKNEMPFGQMPVLEVDGQRIPQSWAIARYVAKQFGFAGKDDFEAAWVDAFGDQLKDHLQELRPLHNVLVGLEQGDKERLRKEIGEPARDKFYSLIEKQLKANNSGWLVGDNITWVDLALAEHSDFLLGVANDFLDDFPAVLAHHKHVHTLPKLKEWLRVRPKELAHSSVCHHPCTSPDLDMVSECMKCQAAEEAILSGKAPPTMGTRCVDHMGIDKEGLYNVGVHFQGPKEGETM